MTKKRWQRTAFVILLLIASGVVVSLIMFALNQNINLFFTPTQVMQGEAPVNARIRVGGMIEKGSVKRGEGLDVSFVITDFSHALKIHYQGILPNLFREEKGVVALGRLRGNIFMADEVLAKHDENYMPPELKTQKNHKGD